VRQYRFANVAVETAAEICSRFVLKKEARPLLSDNIGPREFVEALLANKQYVTGIDFMAHALPIREALWWGCLSVQHACGGNLSPSETEACRAAAQWVLQPTKENRAAALVPAQAAEPASPTGRLAKAVAQIDGTFAPTNSPPVPPVPFAPAKEVAVAVKLAAARVDPFKSVDAQRLFLELGVGVADGRFVWPEIKSRAPVRSSEL
jgi:hypothetical protein